MPYIDDLPCQVLQGPVLLTLLQKWSMLKLKIEMALVDDSLCYHWQLLRLVLCVVCPVHTPCL